ncbi:glycine--tRNA ligase subunit beta [Furfurilactobacillus siliginis]|uniref:Glycine--tRNA ligase beta subunit n=1 Tax=Furfurilactobacillus siliginis TaxID=348151 RepID=A0A0R2L5M0_9LACO|nr:glycine--tRNA ligase subunit beta [Furfurilactobacillus siliginis]KRN97039.1 glycyl-tRNA synthetase subunit beta [Furfurilactobacillus siliginis]GEK27800.1 glycine--tRNA ligase beta subunit [Furfurilactobacillus siliginis]
MAHEFLLEIGLEEIPAHVVTPSINQLVERTTNYLNEQRITFSNIKPFSTPRRLAMLISGLADQQPDVEEEVKGPAKKIAQDADGNWTKAAQGFVRGQGASVDDITFKELKGEEYVYVNKHETGKPVAEVLVGMKDVIMAMTFPTMMKWGSYKFQYVRPIRWIVALLDDQVLPFEILDVTTGRTTQGHRFLGREVELTTPADYEEALTSQFVIVDADKRKARIRKQIEQLAADRSWTITVDEDLLEEVNNLVEWPTTFAGHFDEKYLTIPDEVLITSMRDHQRFFYVTDSKGDLLPNFVSVRNGNAEHLDNVIAGNEKVLTARLEDAMFFYQEDQKHDIDFYVNKLKDVSFHDKIGSMTEHMKRTGIIANLIGQRVGLSDTELADLQRASEIYKFDLVTGMVGEFSELQGVMGEKYALLFGEKPAVAQAIREHYMPISAEGALPQSKIGAALAIADKYDSITAFFAADMIPSGSNDPYALRRQAFGIVRILRDKQWHLPLMRMGQDFEIALSNKHAAFNPDLQANLAAGRTRIQSFMNDRVRQWFNTQDVRHDIVDAVTNAATTDVLTMLEDAVTLTSHASDNDFRDAIEALTRVARLTKDDLLAASELPVEPKLFENDTEQRLYDAVNKVDEHFAEQTPDENYHSLAALRPLIEDYFEANMVMADDDAVRTNRLNQLAQLTKLTLQLGDLKQLIVK